MKLPDAPALTPELTDLIPSAFWLTWRTGTLNTRSGFMTATAIARLLCSGLQLSVHADKWSKDIGVTFMSLWKIPVQVWCRFCRSTVYS